MPRRFLRLLPALGAAAGAGFAASGLAEQERLGVLLLVAAAASQPSERAGGASLALVAVADQAEAAALPWPAPAAAAGSWLRCREVTLSSCSEVVSSLSFRRWLLGVSSAAPLLLPNPVLATCRRAGRRAGGPEGAADVGLAVAGIPECFAACSAVAAAAAGCAATGCSPRAVCCCCYGGGGCCCTAWGCCWRRCRSSLLPCPPCSRPWDISRSRS